VKAIPQADIEGGAGVLILFAHPALERSRVNRLLVEAVRDLPGVTFHDLYEAYPEFDVDVRREQELLERHEVIVLHHPFFWYSTPALLKQWQDLVLQHGWAYGSGGTALVDKRILSVVTTGGRESAYQHEGRNCFTMRELLAPIEQTFCLCGSDYLPPFIAHGTLGMSEDTIRAHARDYRRVVVHLRDGSLDLEAARELPRINIAVDELLGAQGRKS
jgi:glutathione-regulated potassium-efflux system ancillary protein KefG